MKAVQSNGRNGSGGRYSLRARGKWMNVIETIEPELRINRPFVTFLGKPPNYRDDPDESDESRLLENSQSDFQDNDGEPSEPDDATRGGVLDEAERSN